MKSINHLHAARFKLATDKPYFRAALYAMTPIEKPGMAAQEMGRIGVDRYWRLYYDPDAVKQWSVPQLAAVLQHELSHLLRKHHQRADLLRPEVIPWLQAAECEINDDLLAERLSLPGDPITPQGLGLPDGLLAEEYYRLILAQQSRASGTSDGQDDAQSDDQGEGQGKTQGQGDHRATGRQARGNAPGEGRCGSCAGGGPEPYEDPKPHGADDSPAVVSEAKADLLRRHTAEAVRERQKSRGDVPAGLARWADALLSPQIPWQQVLTSEIRAALQYSMGAQDYTYSRMNRRQHAYGRVLLPALRQPIPRVAVVADTSGSMGERELALVLTEIGGILKSLGVFREVTVLTTDSQVHTRQKVFDPRQVQLVGGGGTNMGRGIEVAVQLKPRPQICIVLTDSYTSWPALPPQGLRVVVGRIGGPIEDYPTPVWARAVDILI